MKKCLPKAAALLTTRVSMDVSPQSEGRAHLAEPMRPPSDRRSNERRVSGSNITLPTINNVTGMLCLLTDGRPSAEIGKQKACETHIYTRASRSICWRN